MDVLPTVWFIAIAVLWGGYLLLEGFDLGVGMHMLFSAKNDTQRRVMLNTIGPVWDGNEVWLLTAGAATFAAFPFWYASLFSTLYVPLTIALLALIFRAVSIEYRGKGTTVRWVRFWDWAIGIGSLVTAFCVGAMLALTTTGLPINDNGDRVGGPFVWLNVYAVVGGLALVGFCLVHGAAFLALKSDGSVREKAGTWLRRWTPIALLPLVAWVLIIQFQRGNVVTWALVAVAVVSVVWAYLSARAGREGRAFTGIAVFLAFGAASIFAAVFPVVLPSTIDPAYSLTISNAASGAYTLGVMTWVTAFALPVILGYQAWSYWVFRKRVSDSHIPKAHPVSGPILRREAAGN